jgi:hypothetical protein
VRSPRPAAHEVLLADGLDGHFAGALGTLTAREHAALAAYQGTDRLYDRINGLLRGGPVSSDPGEAGRLADLIDNLYSAIGKGDVPDGITVWRGLRDRTRLFGTDPDEPLVGAEIVLDGFTSVSVYEHVARGGFLSPGGPPALLQLQLQPGLHAAWMPTSGDPDMAWQGELLLASPVTMTVEDRDWEPATTTTRETLIIMGRITAS